MKVAILGAGNAAQTFAGDLSLRGHEVRLWENPAFSRNIKNLLSRGGRIRLTGAIEGEATISLVTTDADEALSGAQIVYCVMPSFGQASAFDHILPHLKENQCVMLMPGNFGALTLQMKLSERGMTHGILIGESDTIPYAARIQPDGSSLVFGLKETVYISAIPAQRTEDLIAKLLPAFPIGFTAFPDVLSVALSNTNMILHCPTMLLNTGRIESGHSFRFYNDGMTKSVCKVMEAMDEERLAVGEKFACRLIPEYEDALLNYNLERPEGRGLYDVFHNHPVYGAHGFDSPSSMNHRYFSEDVPFLLAPVSELGVVSGVQTNTIDAVITLAGLINSEDYRKTGRGLSKLGLEGLSAKAIERRVKG